MADKGFRVRELALTGRLRTADEPTTIGPTDVSKLINLRPSDQGPRGIAGMTKINTSALASTGIRNGFHFRKSQPAESHVLAWTSDGKVWVYDGSVPAQGALALLFTDTAGGTTGRFANAPGGALAYANGVEACLWGGTEHRCSGFIDYPTTGQIYDYSDLITNTKTDANNVATIHTLYDGTEYSSTTYIGSIMPLDGVKLYVKTFNPLATGTATMQMSQWNGAWSPLTITDNTALSSRTLEQTGTVTWASTAASSRPTQVEKVYLYWYKMVITSSANFAGITLSQVTVSIPFQAIKDIWDGSERPANSVLGYKSSVYFDFTSNVLENGYTSTGSTADASTYASLTGYTSSDYLYVGCIERLSGLMFNLIDANVNVLDSIMSVSYWDGTAWMPPYTIMDGTANEANTKTLSRSGWVTWSAQDRENEFKRSDLGGGKAVSSMYYYRIGFSATITNPVNIYHLAGIPVPKDIHGYAFPVNHQNRTVLVSNTDGLKNSILMSAPDMPNTFNGLDSYEYPFGQNEEINASASLFLRLASSVQDMLVLTKAGEVHLLEGNGSTSDPYRTRLLSSAIGCRAPLTMTTIPVGDLGNGVRRQIAVWESQRGIEVFDGAALMDPLLSHDIRDKFDPRNANYAGSSSNTGFYDAVYDEYHWCPVGTAEWVFSFKYKKWYQGVRGTAKYLYGGIPVMDTIGNTYVYGFDNAGYVYRLENGTDFDGNDIVHTLKTGAIALNENKISEQTTLRMVKVVQVAKNVTGNLMTVRHFGDTDTTGNSLGTIDPAATGKRLRSAILNAGSKGPHVHHEFQLSMTTDDEVSGCEPIYIVAYYDGERQDVR